MVSLPVEVERHDPEVDGVRGARRPAWARWAELVRQHLGATDSAGAAPPRSSPRGSCTGSWPVSRSWRSIRACTRRSTSASRTFGAPVSITARGRSARSGASRRPGPSYRSRMLFGRHIRSRRTATGPRRTRRRNPGPPAAIQGPLAAQIEHLLDGVLVETPGAWATFSSFSSGELLPAALDRGGGSWSRSWSPHGRRRPFRPSSSRLSPLSRRPRSQAGDKRMTRAPRRSLPNSLDRTLRSLIKYDTVLYASVANRNTAIGGAT